VIELLLEAGSKFPVKRIVAELRMARVAPAPRIAARALPRLRRLRRHLEIHCGQESCGTAKAHLISAFGGEQEVAAIAGAIVEQGIFQVRGPGIAALRYLTRRGCRSLPRVDQRAGAQAPSEALVAVSKELALTWRGGDLKARQTVVCSDDPQFVLYRIGVRFGLPVLAGMERMVLARTRDAQCGAPACRPGLPAALVTGTKSGSSAGLVTR